MSQTDQVKTGGKDKMLQIVFLLMIILAVSLYYWYFTDQGLVLTPDSITYRGAAQNILEGKGLTVPFGFPPNQPLAQFPPLVPWVLVLTSKLGLTVLATARWINLILLIIFMLVSNQLLIKITSFHWLLRLFMLAFVGFSLVIFYLFTTLGSEPFMIVLGFLSVYFFVLSEEKDSHLLLLVSAIFAALSLASRYAGITYTGSLMIAVLFIRREKILQKFLKLTLLATPTLLFLAYWLLRDVGSTSSATNRLFLLHPVKMMHITSAINTISNWFLVPERFPMWSKLLVTIGISSLILWVIAKTFLRPGVKNREIVTYWTAIYFCLYPFFILFAISFVDANIPLDRRMLSPIFVLLPMIFLSIAHWFDPKISLTARTYAILSGLLFTSLMVILFVTNHSFVQRIHKDGFGFNFIRWRNEPAFTFLNSVDANTFLVSNAPEPVYLYTGKPVFRLPRQFNSMEDRDNPTFSQEVAQLKSEYLTNPAFFIFFKNIRGGETENQNWFVSQYNLIQVEDFDEIIIYQYTPGQR